MRSCSYCHQRGHNKATCQKLKSYVENNPNCYTARVYNDKKKNQATRSPSLRVCGYCSESGHNRRTCPKMSNDRYKTAKANRAWRVRFIEKAKQIGFAPGALMELKTNEDMGSWARERLQEQIKKHGSLAMVVGFHEECLNKDLQEECYLAGHKRTVVKIRFPTGLTSDGIEKRFTGSWKCGKAGVDDQLGLND